MVEVVDELEKDVERAVCEYARKTYDALALKFTSPGRCGVPDRLFLFPNGGLVFIEFKRPGGQMTGAQTREATRIRDRKQRVACIDDVGLGKALVDQVAATPVPARRG